MCGRTRHIAALPLVALALLSSIPACGPGEDEQIVVVLSSGSGERQVVTLEELGLTELTDEINAIFDKYQAMAEGVTDLDELTALHVKCAQELGELVRSKQTKDQMLHQGMVVGVYKGIRPEGDGPPKPLPGAVPVEIR